MMASKMVMFSSFLVVSFFFQRDKRDMYMNK
jgi:hypothetical protein